MQPASNPSAAVIAEDNLPTTASPNKSAPGKQSVHQKKSSKATLENNEEHAVLISALNDGVVHYRIRLKNTKEPLQGVSVTLFMPKHLLYMTGTTHLDGKPVSDPEVNGSILKYTFTKLPDEKKFDLKLQTLVDDDTQSTEAGSSVTVIITDADDKPVRTFTATSELSDDMQEFNSTDLPPADEKLITQVVSEKKESEEYQEHVAKTATSTARLTIVTLNSDNGLHVSEDPGILSPAEGSVIVNQINAVRIVLNSSLTPVLTLDGKEIPAERIGFSMKDDKWGIISGLINEQGLNWGWTSRLQLLHTQSVGGSSRTDGDLRLGLAFRPPVTKWIILDRLDLIATDEKSVTTSNQGRRIVNNLNANYKPDKKTQLSIQYGAKYVFEKIADRDYNGYTDLLGLEGRYDITREWDIGLRTSVLHSWAVDQYGYSLGPSIGYNVMENAWISLGYNIAGFKGRDFSAANYTAQGPFVQFRFKFDQNSVKEGLKMLGQ